MPLDVLLIGFLGTMVLMDVYGIWRVERELRDLQKRVAEMERRKYWSWTGTELPPVPPEMASRR